MQAQTRRRVLSGAVAALAAVAAASTAPAILASAPFSRAAAPGPWARLRIWARGAATPQDFGAQGDGVHDDTAALQAALDYIPAETVLLPPGTYILTRSLRMFRSTTLAGSGATLDGTRVDGPCLFVEAPGATIEGLCIRG